jgi:hypothetical protein
MDSNRYETAVSETRSVLGEWMDLLAEGQRIDSPHARDVVARKIVDRLVAKGIIQSTDPDDLQSAYREGPLAPGRTIVGGPAGGPWTSRAERFEATKQWVLDEHGETLRRLGEGPSDD